MRLGTYHLLLVVAALFLAGLVANIVTDDVTVGDTIIQVAIACVCSASFVFIRRKQRERDAFFEYIVANQDVIRSGKASFRDQPLTYATRLHTYELVLSFLVISFRLPTRPVVHGSRAATLRIGCTLVTLLLGWWGIPWGPIWTIRALARNFGASATTTIAELLEGPSAVNLPRSTARRLGPTR